MKRIFTMLFATMLLTAALAVNASASDFDAVAEDLSAIGMFRGTGSGFELDSAPTRSQAAIMLVRLYGAEEQAAADYTAGTISHPFTDVSDIAAPYVAYLYTNGIANGTSATTFGSAKTCSAQNYVVFLLRALGYADGTDFQYADALTFAQSKGFYDPMMFSGAFLRDDLAAITYQALGTDLKDGSTYLLDSLIKAGAIDKEKAAPMTAKIEAYRGMVAATSTMDATALDADIDMKMDMTATMAGETEKTTSDVTGSMKMIVDGTDVQMAYTMKTATEGVSVDMGMWMKDGWMYMTIKDAEESFSYKYQIADELEVLEGLEGMQMADMNVSGLAMIDSITAAKSGSDTVYTMVIGKGMAGILDGVMSMLGDEGDGFSMTIGDITAIYTVDRNGNLKSMKMAFSAAMTMDLGEELGTMDAAYDYDIAMTIKAMGDSVKITYPDFSAFQEMDPTQVPELAA